MKKLLFFLILTLSTFSVYAENEAETEKKYSMLSIDIYNIEEVAGNIIITVYNDKDEFMENKSATYAFFYPVTDKNMLQKIKLPYGKYSILVFHDINENKILDKNKSNHPIEKFGYSNNYLGRFGSKPPYEKTVINLDSDEMEIKINLK